MTREILAEQYPDLLIADGLDDAILGVCHRACGQSTVAYDERKVIEILMSWEMTHDEATDFYYFNTLGAHLGPTTPCYIELLRADETVDDQLGE